MIENDIYNIEAKIIGVDYTTTFISEKCIEERFEYEVLLNRRMKHEDFSLESSKGLTVFDVDMNKIFHGLKLKDNYDYADSYNEKFTLHVGAYIEIPLTRIKTKQFLIAVNMSEQISRMENMVLESKYLICQFSDTEQTHYTFLRRILRH